MKTIWIIGLCLVTCQVILGQCGSLVLGLLDSVDLELERENYDVAAGLLEHTSDLCSEVDDSSDVAIAILIARSYLAQAAGSYETSMNHIQDALLHFGQRKAAKPHLLAEILNVRARTEFRIGRFEKSKMTADSARQMASHGNADLIQLQRAFTLLGNAHQKCYEVEKAIEMYEKSKELAVKIAGPGSILEGKILNNLANCFHVFRQYEKALSYLNHTLNIYIKTYGKDHFTLNTLHYNLGLNYSDHGQQEKAIYHFQESSRLLATQFPNHHYLAENSRKIGDSYRLLREYSKAAANYQTAASIYEISGKHYNEVGQLHNAMAHLHSDQSNHQAALAEVDQAIALTSQHLGHNHPRVASMVTGRIINLKELGRLAEAKAAGHNVLDILKYRPSDFDADKCLNKSNLYHNLGALASVYYDSYKNNGNVPDLRKALKFYEDGIALITPLRLEMDNERSKHDLSRNAMWLYEGAVASAFEIFHETDSVKYFEVALQFSEQSRQSTALEAILSRSNSGFPGVPESTIEQEQKLVKEISSREIEIQELEQEESRSAVALNSKRDSLFFKKQQLGSFLDSLNKTYPSYFEYRYRPLNHSVASWQNALGANQGIIEFLDTKDHIYQFLLTKNDLHLRRIPISENLRKDLEQFRQHSSNPDSILIHPEYSQKILQRNSINLFNIFMTDLPGLENLDDLVIIPDGLESNIIFEILQPDSLSYLFDRFQIYYAQSLKFWQKQQQISSRPTLSFAGFAPTFGDIMEEDTMDSELLAAIVRSGNLHLPATDREVREIQQIMGGRAFFDLEASKASMINGAAEAQIIHLSTHALLDQEDPARSMFLLASPGDSSSNEQLTAAEICHLELQAELAVLSACHTGSGQLSRGEGTLSLGRAFAFAGVPAIVQSLWKVPDQATAQFMPHFYEALKQGYAKHEALNRARRAYLDGTSSAKLRHPYFWAGFVLYGNSSPLVPLDRPMRNLWLLATILLATSLIVKMKWFT